MDDEEFDPIEEQHRAIIQHSEWTREALEWIAEFNELAELDESYDQTIQLGKLALMAKAMRHQDFHFRWVLLCLLVPDHGPIDLDALSR